MYYLGIDCGKNGGFAILKDHEIINYAMFDKQSFLTNVDWLSRCQERTVCCLEQVHSMPKQGVASSFSFGESYGWLKGVLDAKEISYQEIKPQIWKKEFGLNTDKKKSIEVCQQLFPDANLVPHNHRTAHDGIAESILMAEYARRKL